MQSQHHYSNDHINNQLPQLWLVECMRLLRVDIHDMLAKIHDVDRDVWNKINGVYQCIAESEKHTLDKIAETNERIAASEQRTVEKIAEVNQRIAVSEQRTIEKIAETNERIADSEQRLQSSLHKTMHNMTLTTIGSLGSFVAIAVAVGHFLQ